MNLENQKKKKALGIMFSTEANNGGDNLHHQFVFLHLCVIIVQQLR